MCVCVGGGDGESIDMVGQDRARNEADIACNVKSDLASLGSVSVPVLARVGRIDSTVEMSTVSGS